MKYIVKNQDFKNLLKNNYESKYYNFINDICFDDKQLKKDFLCLLETKNLAERITKWDNLKININNLKEIFSLSNPFFIGFGNPDSNILFIGKEKGFDILTDPRILLHESINNISQWEYINCNGVNGDLTKQIGFNPLFMNEYYRRKLSLSSTLGIYAKIVSKIYGIEEQSKIKKQLSESDKFDDSFMSKCFFTELNYKPSKYSPGNNQFELLDGRKEMLQHEFYKKFETVVVGAKGYLSEDEFKDFFGIDENYEITQIKRSNKKSTIDIFRKNDKTIIHCNQLSGGARWSDYDLDTLVKEINKQ